MACWGSVSPPSFVPWAAALLLALGVDGALALPEVQRQVRGQAEAESLVGRTSRSPTFVLALATRSSDSVPEPPTSRNLAGSRSRVLMLGRCSPPH